MDKKIIIDRHTSLEEAMSEFKILTDLNASLERQIKETTELNCRLVAENETLLERVKFQDAFYGEQYEKVVDHRDRLQRKCVALITRLAGIKETIIAAERDAHDEAIRDPGAPQLDGLSPQDQRELETLVRSLPKNETTKSITMIPDNRYQ